MYTIAHQVWIDAPGGTVYQAVTTSEGISGWWIADCTLKAEVGHLNIFRMGGHVHNKMLVSDLRENQYMEWECVNDNGLWTGTRLSFEIIEKNGVSVLNFRHSLWPEMTDFFAICNFHWARHLLMLKALCETGENQLNPVNEAKWGELYQKINT